MGNSSKRFFFLNSGEPDVLFARVPGVIETRVGYTGGAQPFPTYARIKDHTESVQIVFDPSKVSFAQLLDLFWFVHRFVTDAGS